MIAIPEYRDQTYRSRGIKLIINHAHVAKVLRLKHEIEDQKPSTVVSLRGRG